MVINKKELLSCCAAELPEQEVQLKNGMTVKVRALKGSEVLRVSSIENLDEKLFYALPKGLVDPVLNSREIQKLIDYNSELAVEIFTAVMELSNALGEAESDEYETAKKN